VVDAAGALADVSEAPAEAWVTAIVWFPIERFDEESVETPSPPPPTATSRGPLVTCALSDVTLPEEIWESAWASESTEKVIEPPMAPSPTVAVASSVVELGIHACQPEGDARVSETLWSVAMSVERAW
jgi:hypothetical protein